MIVLLEEEGLQFLASEEDLYNFIISISKGDTKFEEIVEWLRKNSRSTT